MNGDGYADLVRNADSQDAGADDEGNAFVYHGRLNERGYAGAPPDAEPLAHGQLRLVFR